MTDDKVDDILDALVAVVAVDDDGYYMKRPVDLRELVPLAL